MGFAAELVSSIAARFCGLRYLAVPCQLLNAIKVLIIASQDTAGGTEPLDTLAAEGAS
jgi:hypothetical protein